MSTTRSSIPSDIGQFLAYDPVTGTFVWKVSVGSTKAGAVAGSILVTHDGQRYWRIKVRNKNLMGHRVAWFLTNGSQPPAIIDHKDGDGTNNRWLNLRAATPAMNGANRRKQGGHSKGAHCYQGRWQSYIRVGGKKVHLGIFDTEAEAHAAYVAAAEQHFGEFARAA